MALGPRPTHALLARFRNAMSRASTRRGIPLLLAVLVGSALLWGLVELSDEMLEGSTHATDRRLLLLFRDERGMPAGPPWLQEMMRDFTGLGGIGVLTVVTLGVAGFLALDGKPRAAVLLVVAAAGGVLVGSGLKLGFARPRPDLVPHGSIVSSASFPSGHSTMAAVIYLTCAILVASYRRRLAVAAYAIGLAVLLAVVVAVSRVYLGVHWPTDVLAGLALGAAWALTCWVVLRLLQAARWVERE